MDDFDRGWLVGIFEGEGTIVIRSTDRRKSVRVAVGSTDLDVVQRFQQLAGGNLNGPYNRGEHKPIWHWRMDRQADVAAFLRAMRPHLGERRGAKADEALAVITAWEDRKAGAGPALPLAA